MSVLADTDTRRAVLREAGRGGREQDSVMREALAVGISYLVHQRRQVEEGGKL